MNLKHFYYRTYFKDIDLHQPVKEQDQVIDPRKEIEKKNEPLLKAKNQILTTSKPSLPSQTSLPPGNIAPLILEVQNPGLLPGIGYPHEVSYAGEFKLGFHFDHTSGLPVLPGSTVKGVLRSLWPQYAYSEIAPTAYNVHKDAKYADLQPKKAGFILNLLKKAGVQIPASIQSPETVCSFVHKIELALFEGWDALSMDSAEPKHLPIYKRIVFFDAFPVRLSQTRDGERLLGRDALTPHPADPLKNPKPLPFVKVLPGVQFAFSFRLHNLEIQKVGEGEEGVTISAEQMIKLFELLLKKTGAGAKTNVGYGQLARPATDTSQQAPEARVSAVSGQKKPDNSNLSSIPVRRSLPNLKYDKKLSGNKDVVGELLRKEDTKGWFKLVNVQGFDKEVETSHNLMSTLEVGKRYPLWVGRVVPADQILEAKIGGFKPLD